MVRLSSCITIFFLTVLLFTGGCYNKTIRHLASDAVLIKTGVSSRNDVLTYLGEPDDIRVLGDEKEQWTYIEKRPGTLQFLPLVGGYFGGGNHETIVVVLQDDIVQSSLFREFSDDDFDWAETYTPQEKNE
ncbi:MAG: hypothetical protein V2I36_01565 [Desulfopila sp.]|nr:hypothetical protein [Desulfopila sp.]